MARIPLKIKIFMWQAMCGRLRAADQIRRRNGPGSEFCELCGAIENSNHILFRCPLAQLHWICLGSWLGVSCTPSCFDEIMPLASSLVGQLKRLFWFGFFTICWVLWTTGNKFTIEHWFPSKSVDCISKLSILLQQWKSLTKEDDKDVVELLNSHVKAMASSFLSRDQAQHS